MKVGVAAVAETAMFSAFSASLDGDREKGRKKRERKKFKKWQKATQCKGDKTMREHY